MSAANKEIHKLRREIDQTDKVIIEKIAERMHLSHAIGVLKKKQGLPIRDRVREKEMKALHNRLTGKNDLNSELVAKIFRIILNESRKIQK